MSFILDALRKSERERQQQATPGIGDAGYGPPKKTTSSWLIAVIAILVVNILLVAALLLREDSDAPATRTVQPAPVPRATPAPARRPALTAPKREDIRSLAEEVPAEEVPGAADTDAAGAGGTVAANRPAPAVAALATPAPEPAATPSTSSATAGLPSMEQVVLEGRLEMNVLRLDIHVYSEQPAQRFVFINMTKYREGEALKEGPRVENITPDGVVLSHQGNRFVLTR